MHLDIKAALAKLPMRNPVAVSPHDSFGYFSLAYGVQFIAVKGLSTEAHASARDVARLIDKVRSHSAHGLFLENISDPRLLQQISRETKVQPGGALFSDALSAADGDAPTYIAMMRHNVRTLVQGLAPQ